MPREGKAEIAEKWKTVHGAFSWCSLSGIHKKFDEVMEDEKVIASSILIPKFKDNWTDDNLQVQKG